VLRFNRHNNGYEKSTKKGIPWKLTWKSEMTSRSEAVKLERKLKNINRKKLLDFIKKFNQGVVSPEIHY
jgi:putative endonuclease